jgi:ornithine cyclodeaminase
VSLEEIHGADALVTATRSAEPLLRADLLQSNALIAAIGSSKPNTRELGEDCMRQAQHVIVEWKEQTFREAGEFALLQELTPIVNKTVEIGEVLRSPTQYRTGIRIYKSVGVGIEDVALAHYIHQKLNR